ncbi:RIMS-binding protein 2-like [Ptychodera flava]|uniref:RIMS-binding protein 2-like n=1 Tax=Ptychodera flava TaxID=63121 RepID=UPI003969D082
MLAIFDYDPRLSSPNVDADVELAFRTGDIITVFGDMDEDGFFMGELYGQRGLVPSNFLEDMPTSSLPNSHPNNPMHTSSEKASPSLLTKKENSTKSPGKETKTQDNGPQAKNLTPNTDSDNKKKNKGFFSKGKALFKKFGTTSESNSTKQKR